MILDLSNLPTSAKPTLTAMNPTKGKNGLIWLASLTCTVDSRRDAQTAESFLSGALNVWQGGQQGARASLTDNSEYELLRLALIVDGRRVQAFSEIDKITLNVRGSSASITYKFKIHGLLPLPAALLAEQIGGQVSARVESLSTLNINSSNTFSMPTDQSRALLINWLDDNAQQLTGFAVEVEEDAVRVSDFDCFEEVVKNAAIVSTLSVKTEDGVTFREFTRELCEAGCTVSDLVDGIAAAFAGGFTQADQDRHWLLNDKVKTAAIAVRGQVK